MRPVFPPKHHRKHTKLVPEPMPVVTLADTLRELFDRYGLYMLMLILLVIMVVTALPRKKTEVGLELATAEAAAGVWIR